MKDPAFLFYPADFLIGVMDMTMEERGQYITLMALQHQKGHLPEKTIRLCVGSVSDIVLNKFIKDKDGLLYNKRLDEEIEKRCTYTESRRLNGLKGGRPKINKINTEVYGLPCGKPTENHTENVNININEDINKDNKGGVGEKEETKPKEKSTSFKKPTIEELQEHIISKDYSVDAEEFFSFYESNGWKVGKNPMKSWQSALTTWQKRNNKELLPKPVRRSSGFYPESKKEYTTKIY